MELKVIEDLKNRIKIEVVGEGHSFCNALRKELWNDKHVKIAGYTLRHSLISNPVFIVETDDSEKPKQALKKAVERLLKTSGEFKKKFKANIK